MCVSVCADEHGEKRVRIFPVGGRMGLEEVRFNSFFIELFAVMSIMLK